MGGQQGGACSDLCFTKRILPAVGRDSVGRSPGRLEGRRWQRGPVVAGKESRLATFLSSSLGSGVRITEVRLARTPTPFLVCSARLARTVLIPASGGTSRVAEGIPHLQSKDSRQAKSGLEPGGLGLKSWLCSQQAWLCSP